MANGTLTEYTYFQYAANSDDPDFGKQVQFWFTSSQYSQGIATQLVFNMPQEQACQIGIWLTAAILSGNPQPLNLSWQKESSTLSFSVTATDLTISGRDVWNNSLTATFDLKAFNWMFEAVRFSLLQMAKCDLG